MFAQGKHTYATVIESSVTWLVNQHCASSRIYLPLLYIALIGILWANGL